MCREDGRMKVIGIDMTQSSKPCSLAVLSGSAGKVVLEDVRNISDDEAIIQFCLSADVVAMDSPLFLPLGLCCLEESCGCQPLLKVKGRECEREFSRRRISSYYTTKRTFIKRMIYRSMRLSRQISSSETTVIEVYPYASSVSLFGDKLPSKKKYRKDYYFLVAEKISNLISGISLIKSYDQADAVLAAYTGWLWCQGQVEGIGTKDEGYLWIPVTIT
jgi:predicted nuclease with RNAse H fold